MLYDLCECYNKQHKSTLKYNIPYALARGEKKKLDLSRYPKGTYFVICPNGTNPLMYKTQQPKTTYNQEEQYLQKLQHENKLDSPELIEELPEDY